MKLFIDDVFYVGPDYHVWPRTILVGRLEFGYLLAKMKLTLATKNGIPFIAQVVGIQLIPHGAVATGVQAGLDPISVGICLFGQPELRDIVTPYTMSSW